MIALFQQTKTASLGLIDQNFGHQLSPQILNTPYFAKTTEYVFQDFIIFGSSPILRALEAIYSLKTKSTNKFHGTSEL